MKVAHIFKTYFPDTQGGLEETIRQITKYTTRRGIENRIITVSDFPHPGRIEYPEATVFRYQVDLDILSTPMSIDFLNHFHRAIRDCDLLHFHFPWPFAELSYLFSKISKPAMVTYHADVEKYGLIKRCYQPFIQRFLAKMDRIVVTSRQYLDSSTDLKPFRHKCRVIPLSLDTRRFTLPDAKIMETTEKKYGRDFFLFVGVLRHYKGISFLLDAMQQVKGSLIIVGKGKEKAGLERQCRQLGLKNVRFTGYVEDRYLPAFYTLCRAFVFPSISRSEAFGVSLLEASYFARPMITTELSTGTSFVNRHRLTGLIVPPRDPIALQHAMNTLHDEPLLCQTYGENAGKRFNSHFTADISGSLYMDMYKKILQSSHQYRK